MDIWHKAKLLKKVFVIVSGNVCMCVPVVQLPIWYDCYLMVWYTSCSLNLYQKKIILRRDGEVCCFMFVISINGTEENASMMPFHQWTFMEILIGYFTRGDSDYVLLQKIATDKTWMKSLKYFTGFRYSSGQKKSSRFHSVLFNLNASKTETKHY